MPQKLKKHLEQNPLSFPEQLEPDLNSFKVNDEIRSIAEEVGVGFMSLPEVFCEGTLCTTRINTSASGIVAWDHDHLTKASSDYLVEAYLPLIRAGVFGQ